MIVDLVILYIVRIYTATEERQTMNYIPFGPTTQDTDFANGTHRTGSMSLDVADSLVARGHARNAKESKMRFSTLIKTLQREAMPNMEYPAHGAKWVETKGQYDYSFVEKLSLRATGSITYLTTFEKDGRTWLKEVNNDYRNPDMTQAIPLAEWWNYQIGGK
jgi:hypothetical protein